MENLKEQGKTEAKAIAFAYSKREDFKTDKKMVKDDRGKNGTGNGSHRAIYTVQIVHKFCCVLSIQIGYIYFIKSSCFIK